jgi:hypothetical protein
LRKQVPQTKCQSGYEPDGITVTPAMIEAGQDYLRSRYADSPRLLADASLSDIAGLIIACTGAKLCGELEDIAH